MNMDLPDGLVSICKYCRQVIKSFDDAWWAYGDSVYCRKNFVEGGEHEPVIPSKENYLADF
jgi:hypothetical protein